MTKHILILTYALLISSYCHCQNSRTPINISNDFYTIKISEGISLLKGQRVSSEKNGTNSFILENVSLKRVLEIVFPNYTLKFVDNNFSNELLNANLIFRGVSLEEFQPLFIQQISNYLPIKIADYKSNSEKWTLQSQDTVLLSKKIHITKLTDSFDKKVHTMVSFDTNGSFSATRISLDAFAKNLSRQIQKTVENKIQSKNIYDFELNLTRPIDYADIKKQLEAFGFQVIAESYNNKTLEILSK